MAKHKATCTVAKEEREAATAVKKNKAYIASNQDEFGNQIDDTRGVVDENSEAYCICGKKCIGLYNLKQHRRRCEAAKLHEENLKYRKMDKFLNEKSHTNIVQPSNTNGVSKKKESAESGNVINKDHKKNDRKKNHKSQEIISSDGVHSCLRCDKTFLTKEGAEFHEKQGTCLNKKNETINDNEFECACGNVYGSSVGLDSHKITCQLWQRLRESNAEYDAVYPDEEGSFSHTSETNNDKTIEYIWDKNTYICCKERKKGKKLNYYRTLKVKSKYYRCTFNVGDHVSLPNEEAGKPDVVGKIIDLFEVDGKRSKKVNIQWFYRVDDLLEYFENEKEILNRLKNIDGMSAVKLHPNELFVNYESKNVNLVQAVSSKFECVWLHAVRDHIPTEFNDKECDAYFTRFTCRYNDTTKKYFSEF